MTDVLAVAATAFGAAMSLGPLMQLGRVRHRQSAGDLSLAYVAVVASGTAVWTAYGVVIANVAVVAANLLGALTSLALLIVALRLPR